MASLWAPAVPVGSIVLRGAVVYACVLGLLRAGGKREIGQMGPGEFVALLLISNAVQNAMNGGDNSLSGGLLLAAVLIFVSWLISVLTFHSRRFSAIFEGTPTLLIHRGHLITKHLSRERMCVSELRTILRKQGVHNFEEVENAVLEADGTVTISRVSDSLPRTQQNP